MNNLEVFNLCKEQYETIDSQLESLSKAIRNEVPADQIPQRLRQLSLGWDQAHLNYIIAGNKVFDANTLAIKEMLVQAKEAQASIKTAIEDLRKVANALDAITSAVAVLTSLVSMGSPLAV